MPDIGNWASPSVPVTPDILYRESLLPSFQMDPRGLLAEMTKKIVILDSGNRASILVVFEDGNNTAGWMVLAWDDDD